MRIPREPLLPYIKTPSLYFTYSPINIIKQWLLNFLWLVNKNQAKKYSIPTSYFFGILFSGKMDEKRVRKILPKYVKKAKKDGAWLHKVLRERNATLEGTWLLTVDEGNRVYYIPKEEKT